MSGADGDAVSGNSMHGGPRRRDHRGREESVASHTFFSSENNMAPDDEQEPAWFPKDDAQYDESVWDPKFLEQMKAGHTKANDCIARQALTQHFYNIEMKRPTAVHW